MATSITSKGTSLGDWSGWDFLPGIAFIVVGVLALMQAPLASHPLPTLNVRPV